MQISLQKKKKSRLFFLSIISIILFTTGCAGNKTVSGDTSEIDPYEEVNRTMFAFNEGLDDYVASPVSDAYRWVVPQFLQIGVSNFFSNLDDINVVLNDLMQGKFQQGAKDMGRFALNSTVGWFGLMDVAKEVGLEKHDEDFAQTLAVWGVPRGPYIVVPLLGPITGRGMPGIVFDTATNPASYVGFPVSAYFAQRLNERANAEESLQFIDEVALDPYVFTRDSFLQYRNHLINDGKSEVTSNILDFEDEIFEEDEAPVKLKEVTIDVLESEEVQTVK